QIRGQAPIIILDDIVSELDSHVRRNLLKTIDSLKPQTFFSSTDIEAFGQDVKNVYHIKDGSVVKRE
ncbi:MAG TPA: DNA replication and repair protein RecF, partial [Myxococcota bacterium]|nr:DNA replication and repair protein RecF [Myxococcota bacterium]